MCDCIRLHNEALKTKNTELVTGFNLRDGRPVLLLATRKINSKDRSPWVKSLLAAFCPFCGEWINYLPLYTASDCKDTPTDV